MTNKTQPTKGVEMNTQQITEWLEVKLQIAKDEQDEMTGDTDSETLAALSEDYHAIIALRARLLAADEMSKALEEYLKTDKGKLGKGDLLLFERDRLDGAVEALSKWRGI